MNHIGVFRGVCTLRPVLHHKLSEWGRVEWGAKGGEQLKRGARKKIKKFAD